MKVLARSTSKGSRRRNAREVRQEQGYFCVRIVGGCLQASKLVYPQQTAQT
jgi:hypothetical protein